MSCGSSCVSLILGCPDKTRINVLNIDESVIINIRILSTILGEVHKKIYEGDPLLVLIFDSVIFEFECCIYWLLARKRKVLITQGGLCISPRDINKPIISHSHVNWVLSIK